MQVRLLQPSRLIILLLAVALAACDLAPPAALAPSPAPPPTLAPSPARRPTSTPLPTSTPTPTSSPTPTPPPTPTSIPLTPTATLAPIAAEQRQRIFGQVWRLVRDRYVYPDYGGLDWQAIRRELEPPARAAATPEEFYQVLRQMIRRLGDDHSRFESPQEVAEEQARRNGNFMYGGIGVGVRPQPDGVLITRVVPGGPAERAGLHPRDLILAIDGLPAANANAFGPGGPGGAVRGAPGTIVRLTVRSPGAAPREVELTRQAIDGDAFPPVEALRLPGTNVGLLTIDTFERSDMGERARRQVEALLAEGPLDGLIVDVRYNGGGFVSAMLDTLALFVDGGTIGTSRSRRGADDLRVPPGQTIAGLAGVPLVVLAGADTASAAEMFAAGLRVTGRARVVGMPSAGNLENLVLHTFADGSRLWLAEYAYRLPDGQLLEGHGVQPDRIVDAGAWDLDPASDPQVQAAIEELRHQKG